MTLTAKVAKNFSSAMTNSAGSIMALSGDLKCLCLGESLNISAISRFILENELFSSQGKAESVETAVHGKLEETSILSLRSEIGPSRQIFSVTFLFGLKGNQNFSKGKGRLRNCFA